MGIALLPESVLATFHESKRLTIHRLPRGENRSDTVLIWRRGAGSPNIQPLQQLLHEDVPALRRGTNRKNRPANGL